VTAGRGAAGCTLAPAATFRIDETAISSGKSIRYAVAVWNCVLNSGNLVRMSAANSSKLGGMSTAPDEVTTNVT